MLVMRKNGYKLIKKIVGVYISKPVFVSFVFNEAESMNNDDLVAMCLNFQYSTFSQQGTYLFLKIYLCTLTVYHFVLPLQVLLIYT